MDELEIIRKLPALQTATPEMYRDAVAILYDGIQHGDDLHGLNKSLRVGMSRLMRDGGLNVMQAERLNDTYYKSLLLDARVDFDAYCQYIERDREPKRRFYLPRRKILKHVASELQKLYTGELKLLAISLRGDRAGVL